MYFVYVIQSKIDNRLYVGFTDNLERRMDNLENKLDAILNSIKK